jgi:hypothetical protein
MRPSGGKAVDAPIVATLLPSALRHGPALTGSGAASPDHRTLERDLDARMRRTQRRPLPDGRLRPSQALTFGLAMTATGLLYLTLAGQLLSGLLTSVSVGSYLLLYTPLKQRTPFCLIIGAVPGALPPVTGWVAAAGELPLAAWTLFALDGSPGAIGRLCDMFHYPAFAQEGQIERPLLQGHDHVAAHRGNDGSFGQATPRDTIAGKRMIGMPQDGDLGAHTGPAQQPVEM